MEAALAPQRCCRTWGCAGQAVLVRTGNFTPPEGLAAGPGTCKPWMQSRSADLSKCRAHSTQRAPQTRSQMRTSDLAAIRQLWCARAPAARPQTQRGGGEPAFRASLGQHHTRRRARQLPAGREKATAHAPGPRCRSKQRILPGEPAAWRGAAAFLQSPWRPRPLRKETALLPAAPHDAGGARGSGCPPPQPAPVAALQPPHALPAARARCSARGGSRPPGADARETAGGRS